MRVRPVPRFRAIRCIQQIFPDLPPLVAGTLFSLKEWPESYTTGEDGA